MKYIRKMKDVFRRKSLMTIVLWARPVRWSVLTISFLAVFSSLLSLGLTLDTKSLIDAATSGNRSALWLYAAVLVGLIATIRLCAVLSSGLRTKASANLQRHLQTLVTEAIFNKEYASLKGYHSGELTNRVFSDVSVVKNGIMGMLPSILQTLVSFVGAAVILIIWDWRFVLLLLLGSGIGAVITLAFREPMKTRHKRMQEAEDSLHASTQESLENIRVVKASVSENRTLSEINETRERLVTEQIRNGKLSILLNNGMGVMFDVSWLLCQIWGCVKIFQGTFTYGSLAALIQLMGRIQGPISTAMNLAAQAYGVLASTDRLLEIIDLPDEDAGTELSSFDRIRLENISFRYDDGNDDVLLSLDTTIQHGDFVALTGMSGGGKTSLFQLLLAIYHPTEGRVVFVDGDQQVPACRGTRSLFAYVPQGNTLFSGTLRENLLRFRPEASEEELQKAIHAACLDDLVSEVGLNARLGERGIGLSEGQAQRVAVARALLSNAPILLLDEATSALDEQTEARMLENIGKMRDKTVIIVTHRRAALAICDYELHIEEGHMTRI